MSTLFANVGRKSFLGHQSITLKAGEPMPVACTGAYFKCTEAAYQFQMSVNGGPFFPCEVGLGFKLTEGEQFTLLTFRNKDYANQNSQNLSISFYTGTQEVIDDRLNLRVDRGLGISTFVPRTALGPMPTANTDPDLVTSRYGLSVLPGQFGVKCSGWRAADPAQNQAECHRRLYRVTHLGDAVMPSTAGLHIAMDGTGAFTKGANLYLQVVAQVTALPPVPPEGALLGLVFPYQTWEIEATYPIVIFNPQAFAIQYAVTETWYINV